MFGLAQIGCASAQLRSGDGTNSIYDEFRVGFLAHDIEDNDAEEGFDLNVELLFSRPELAYENSLADIALRPRIHVGSSLNLSGDTSLVYAGLTWDVPLHDKWSLELTLGGAVHDGPTAAVGQDSFGCALNFRESLSIGYPLSEHWRLYGMVSHMSNAKLCDRNSGLTSAGLRLGFAL